MKSSLLRRMAVILAIIVLVLPSLAVADEETDALFDRALANLYTPAELGDITGMYGLHTGDSAYAPCVNPGIIPYDEQAEYPYPEVSGTFYSSDESIVTVSEKGVMTGVAPGEAIVECILPEGEFTYNVTVGDDQLPETVKNYIYVLNREFYSVKRARLPKYNEYAKWYYGRKKEVGWCSVFTIYCANASGNQPLGEKEVDTENPPMVQYFREGQVGNQYDGFSALGRFVDVPKPGYLVIYADMSNAYRTTHIGSVTDVKDMGNGIYAVTTVEGNMSNTVKSYCYLYDSTKTNHTIGTKDRNRLQYNMAELPAEQQTDPLVQYELHTDHWSVFGFCQTWE
ncbi:MAG: Ig-like domain-containing protein [Clostridia bacterium]|nr:Ig-like domain-containing protein [Clostridia bacterium]